MYIIAGIYNIAFGYIYLVKSRALNMELLTDNIWKLCGLYLKDILIHQKFIFIGKDRTNVPERTRTFILKDLHVNIDRPVVNLLIKKM